MREDEGDINTYYFKNLKPKEKIQKFNNLKEGETESSRDSSEIVQT